MDRDCYVTLVNGVKVPLFGLGTSHAGGYSHEAVVYALKDCNYRLLDTARRYGCEKLLGQSIKESGVPAQEIFIVNKLWPTDYGYHTTLKACKTSLEKLGVDQLGLYLMHWPVCPSACGNARATIKETWRAMEKLYTSGMCRSIGVSNFTEDDIEEILKDCSIAPHVNQIEFHPYNNPSELIQYCTDNQIQIQGYCPLGKGKLLDKKVIVDIAKKYNKTAAQILIRWSVENNVITIPKSTKIERVYENSQIFDFTLGEDSLELLNSLDEGLRVVDSSMIQETVDRCLPDGYKL